MKNIAVIVPSLNGGGAERMAANMTLELQKKYNVYLIVFSGENIAYEHGGTLLNVDVPPNKESSMLHHISASIKRAIRVRKLKKKYHIDCSISHMEGASLVNILSKRKDKVISVFHSVPSPFLRENKFYCFMQRFIGKFSDKYIFVSKVAAYEASHVFGINPQNIMPIYNFCNIEKLQNMAKQELPTEEAVRFFYSHTPIFVMAGRLNNSKGQNHLMKAFSKVKEIYPSSGLVLLGEGESRGELEKIAQRLQLQQAVYMPGAVENPFAYMDKSDVFAFSSSLEGLPMVLIEAMACECPIISTDMKSGAREVLAPTTDILQVATEKEYAQYGILVPVCKDNEDISALSKTEQILADAMLEMVSNHEVRERYIESSKEGAIRFSAETIIQQWIDLIEKEC